MNRSTTVAVADAMTAVRADWQQGGCISQIQVAAHTWQGTDAELAAHCLAVAAMPSAHTPAAINAIAPTKVARPGDSDKGPKCHICGNTKDRCRELREFELRHPGIQDPHHFETHEEADANNSHYQIRDPEAQRDLVSAGAALQPIAEQSPERAAAKARARAAVDQARQKSAWKPAPPPSERRGQETEPEPEETPTT